MTASRRRDPIYDMHRTVVSREDCAIPDTPPY